MTTERGTTAIVPGEVLVGDGPVALFAGRCRS